MTKAVVTKQANEVATPVLTAVNIFETKHSIILKSSFKKVKNTYRVVMVLENGDVLFLHPKAVNNATDYILDIDSVKMLQTGSITYEESLVNVGDAFTWNSGDDNVEVATSNLKLCNPLAIMLDTVRTQYLIDNCAANVEAADMWAEMTEDKPAKVEADAGVEEEVAE